MMGSSNNYIIPNGGWGWMIVVGVAITNVSCLSHNDVIVITQFSTNFSHV